MLIALVAGTLFRLAAYGADREFWLDESRLAGNLRSGPVFAIFHALDDSQIVPPGFLILGRSLSRILGDSPWVLRLLPLLSGLAALYLFLPLAIRMLPGWTATLALALFAASDELIYFATELKPYSTDVTATVLVLLTAVRLQEERLTPSRWVAWSALGAGLVWLSFPVAFVLAIAGALVILRALATRNWPRAVALTCAPVLWLLSFAVVFAAARAQLGGHPGMWRFWEFAFPPPLSVDPAWIPRRVLFLFVNPGDYHGPFDSRLVALPAIVLAAVGTASLARRDPVALVLVLGPVVLALSAAALRLYPFHGRCVLFLLPGLFLLLAEGAGLLAKLAPGINARIALAIVLLAGPVARDLYHVVEPRQRRGLNPHGDRRPHDLKPDIFHIDFRA
jgi:hypothetical protein